MLKPADIDYLFENTGEVLTPLEAANIVRASDSFICDLIKGGILPCFRVGAHFRLLKRDVVSYFKGTVDQHFHLEPGPYLGPPPNRRPQSRPIQASKHHEFKPYSRKCR